MVSNLFFLLVIMFLFNIVLVVLFVFYWDQLLIKRLELFTIDHFSN